MKNNTYWIKYQQKKEFEVKDGELKQYTILDKALIERGLRSE